jgi:hypothetical protein
LKARRTFSSTDAADAWASAALAHASVGNGKTENECMESEGGPGLGEDEPRREDEP